MISDADLAKLALAAYGEAPTWTGSGVDQNVHITATETGEGDGSLLVIAARGSAVPLDWVLDFAAIPTLMHALVDRHLLGLLHAGIAHAAFSVIDRVEEAVKDRRYALIGHSLGGGIALILGAALTAKGIPPARIVTYAAPRVGLLLYHHVLAPVPVTEYKFGNDIVPQLPSFLLHARKTTNIGEPSMNPLECHAMARYAEALSKQEEAADAKRDH